MICGIASGFLVASQGLVLPGVSSPARSVVPAFVGLPVLSAMLVAKPRPGIRHGFVVLLAEASILPVGSASTTY